MNHEKPMINYPLYKQESTHYNVHNFSKFYANP